MSGARSRTNLLVASGRPNAALFATTIRRKLNDRHRPGWSFGDRSVVRAQVPNLRLDPVSTQMGDEAGDRAIDPGGTDHCELTDVGNADGPPVSLRSMGGTLMRAWFCHVVMLRLLVRVLIVESGFTRGALAACRSLAGAGWTVGIGSPDKYGLAASSRHADRWHEVPPVEQDLDTFLRATEAAVIEGAYEAVFCSEDAQALGLSFGRETAQREGSLSRRTRWWFGQSTSSSCAAPRSEWGCRPR